MLAHHSAAPADVVLDQSLKHRILTPKVRRLASQMWEIVRSKAVQNDFPLEGAYLDVDEDPSEQVDKAVIVVYANAKAQQVLAFWDEVGLDVDRWVTNLDRRDCTTAIERLYLQFNWID